ncbi:MAG: hypothetical protein P9M06_06840 [Candidatus Saelkia tenebricola]|nr:hypothetical protein [Candidatus Saelkia tenebricola]
MIKIGPVSLEKFLGRSSELKRLGKIESDYIKGYRRNLAIIGDWGIGKTSLVLKYIHQGVGEELFPIYLNLEEGFLKESFLGFLLFSLRRLAKIEATHFTNVIDVGKIIESEFPFLGSLVRNIETAQKNGNYEIILKAIFNMPKAIKDNFDKNCLFVIDEFFGFEKCKVRSWPKVLREHIMLDKHALFVLISSDTEKSKAMLNSEFSLLFGNFEIIELNRFSCNESLDFAKKRIGGIKKEEKVLDDLLFLTHGMPLYLDLLTNWMRDNLSVLDREGLMLTIKENLLDNKGFLYRYFQEKLDLSPGMERFQEFLPFVMEVARGNTKKKNLKKKNFSYAEYNYSMNGFLEKNGSFYRIKDPLFRIWLLYAYKPDLMGLKLGLEDRIDFISEEIEKLNNGFSGFRIRSLKNSLNAIIEKLFLKFENEFIELQGRRKLLPKFASIEVKSENEEYLILEGSKLKGGKWLIVLFHSKIEEPSVYKLLSSLKEDLNCYSQKVGILISDIDDNTQSMLKTKGFWIWDSLFVTKLLEFYGTSGIFNAGCME